MSKMNNAWRRTQLRRGFQQLLSELKSNVEALVDSQSHNLRVLSRQILDEHRPVLNQLSAASHPTSMDTDFVDTVMAAYVGFQKCLLGNDFVLDREPEMQRFISEKLDKAEEYLKEFYENDFSGADNPEYAQAFYEAAYGKGDAVMAARLECIESLLNHAGQIMKMGVFPVPPPQYPSGSTSRSSSWAEAPPEIQ